MNIFGLCIFRYLIEHKARITAQIGGGVTPFMLAAKQGKLDILKFFYNTKDGKIALEMEQSSGLRAFHYAALNGQLLSVRFLISVGVDLEAKTKANDTALNLACQMSLPNTITELILSGADTSSF